jgi:hypothetical protein
MTTTTQTGTPVQSGQPQRQLRAPTTVATRGRRRPGLMVAGIALTALGALVAAWLVTTAGDRTDVLVMARDVPYGSTIRTADVVSAPVAADPRVATVPAADLASVVGKIAATNLAAGTLLSSAELTSKGPPGPNEVLVPLAVTAQRLPVGGLAAGDRLLVVDAPAAGADPPQTEPAAFTVTVARIGTPDLNGVSVIDVVAAQQQGPALATRAATGRFALVVLSAKGAP